MTYDQLQTQLAPLSRVIVATATKIEGNQALFEAAGQERNWLEMNRLREVLKNLVDVQCDAKMQTYRLIEEWERKGARR